MNGNHPPSNNITPDGVSNSGPKSETNSLGDEAREREDFSDDLVKAYVDIDPSKKYGEEGIELLERVMAAQSVADEALRKDIEDRGFLRSLKGIGRLAVGGIQSAATRLKEKFSGLKNKDNTPRQEATADDEIGSDDKSPEVITAEYDKWFNAYALAKAEYNRRGILPFGNRRREYNLKEATEKLNTAEKRKIDIIIEKKRKMGVYEAEGDENEALQAQSDDMFDIMLQMRKERRQAALAEELRQMSPEGGKWYEDTLVKMGDFMRKGGKIAQALKAGGTGFVLNLGVGIFKGLTGATLPVSLAVGGVVAAGSLTVRSAVMKSSMKEQLDKLVNRDGEVLDERFSDDWIKKYINSMRHMGDDDDSIYETLSTHIEDEVKRDDEERYVAAKRAATRSALYFAAGSLLGGVTGMVGSGMVRNALSAQASPRAVGQIEIPKTSTQSPSGVDSLPVDTGGELPPLNEGVDLNGAKYPWDYAKQQVGVADAMSDLKTRANEAVARGHEVVWKTLKNGREMLVVDGKTDTQSVVDVLYGNK